MFAGHQCCGTVVVLIAAVLLFLAVSGAPTADILQTSFLVEFNDNEFKAAVARSTQESAPASTTALGTGTTTNPRRQRVAAAAAGIPAAATLAKSIVSTARASRIRIRRFESFGMVFDGMALEAETAEEANALRDLLRANPKVKKIYPVHMVNLPTFVPATQTQESLAQRSARSTMAAAAAGDGRAEEWRQPAAAAAAAQQPPPAAAAAAGSKKYKQTSSKEFAAAAAAAASMVDVINSSNSHETPALSQAAVTTADTPVFTAAVQATTKGSSAIVEPAGLDKKSKKKADTAVDTPGKGQLKGQQQQQQQQQHDGDKPKGVVSAGQVEDRFEPAQVPDRPRIGSNDTAAVAAAAATSNALPTNTSGSGNSNNSSSQVPSTARAQGDQLQDVVVQTSQNSSSSSSSSSSNASSPAQQQQQQQQQEGEEVFQIITAPVQAPAAAVALPPARLYDVYENHDNNFDDSSSSSSNSSSSSSNHTGAFALTPTASSSPDPSTAINNSSSSGSGSGSSSSSSRPPSTPRKDTPPYLSNTKQIGGIDSTVRLPLAPGGEDIHFTPNLEWGAADLLTGVTELRTNFGLTGKGIRIGIIDTGIDYTHPAFGGCTAINEPVGVCRVVAGKDLVGNDFVNGKDVPRPDNDPRDCHNSSHGTTVAGIAAAGWHPSAPMIGVAPEASLGIYKVFGCKGSAPTSAIIAAIQEAVLDGMDIINLSLSLGPGFPADPYETIMRKVYDLGILAVKSAGNQGTLTGQGLFWVDAYTGTGSITVGSADTSTGKPGDLASADYSTYGPDGNLNLLPHVASPGTNVLTTTAANVDNGYLVISGTSHATPYLSGGLALLLQLHRESSRRGAFRLANAWKSVLAFEQMNQTSVMDALVNTATPVTSDYDYFEPAPVSKSGAGLVNFASAYFNPIEVSPSYIALPSNLNTTHSVTVTLRNNLSTRGPGKTEDLTYSFAVTHRGPAVAMMIVSEWGVMPMRMGEGIGPSATVTPDVVTLGPGESVNVTVKFTLPAHARQRAWLYSGYIDLRPFVTSKVRTSSLRTAHISQSSVQSRMRRGARVSTSSNTDSSSVSESLGADNSTETASVRRVWSPRDRWETIWRYDRHDSPLPTPRPLVIPYQGVSRNYSSIPLIPGPSSYLDGLAPGLCYAPGDEDNNINYPEYAMDIAYDVNECQINTADYWVTAPVEIPLVDIRRRPCDLRITMSPQIPVRRIHLQILNKRGEVLGGLPYINTPVFSRAPAWSYDKSKGSSKMLAVYSYCLSWRGKYTPINAAAGNDTKQASVVAGQTYSFVALLEAPVARGDAAVVTSPVLVKVPIRGKFTVVHRPSAAKRRSRRLLQH